MKAFVGHSFSEKDKSLVDAIKTFLTQSRVQWEDGVPPGGNNPSISDKIRKRIDANDIFIGIFTVDEEIGEQRRRRSFFFSRQPKQRQLQKFTTSNWVIQESGYALGKNKGLILLVEHGVHEFPGLQGDKELIFFDRNDLSPAFVKLLQMFQQLQAAPSATEPIPASVPPEQPLKQEDDASAKKEAADSDAWKGALFEVIAANDSGDMNRVQELYDQKIKPNLSEEKTWWWDALILRWKYCAGDSSALKALETHAQQHRTADILQQLAFCHSFAKKYDAAITVFSECMELTQDAAKKMDFIGSVALSHAKERHYEKAITILLEAASDAAYKDRPEEIFKNLIEIAELKEDGYLFAVFAEQALEINPVNTDLRFSLAYKYSEQDKTDLALAHYKSAVSVQEAAGTLNNLGVAYSELGLKAKAVSCYERAVEKDNTLAAANLAYRYLNEGFTKQAEDLLKRAEALSAKSVEVHGNVGEAKNKMKSLLEEEEKREKDILETARQACQFRIEHSRAFCIPAGDGKPANISGTWRLDKWGDISIVLNVDNRTFEGVVETRYEVPVSPFLGLALGGFLTSSSPEKQYKTRRIQITGEIKNRAGRYKILVSDLKDSPTLLSGHDTVYEAEGLLIVDETQKQISVMEEEKDKNRLFTTWNKT